MNELTTMPEPQLCQEECATESYGNPVEKYIPSRLECLRDYEIGIKFLSRGCIINVGCKQVAFSTIKEAMNAFTDYINDPYTTRQIWEKKFQEEEKL
jgi:hypothetical protein